MQLTGISFCLTFGNDLRYKTYPGPFAVLITDISMLYTLLNFFCTPTKFIMYKSTNGMKERGVQEILSPLSGFLNRCMSPDPRARPDSSEVVSRLIDQYRQAANFL